VQKFIVLDDVFDEPTCRAIAAFDYGPEETWYELGANPVQEKILDICRQHFDLSQVVGYEMWRNTKNPGRHLDKDEILFRAEGRHVFPECSAVYYASVDGVAGGEFYTDDLRCLPRTNRLLMFSPGIYHGVSAFTGRRIAVSLNPWRQRVHGR